MSGLWNTKYTRNINGGALNTKLLIVGGGVTKDRAPLYDASFDVWSTASVGLGLDRCDAIFELHRGVFSAEQLNASKARKYLLEHDSKVENSERFDIEYLEGYFGKRFNGTVVMMLGYAFLMEYQEVHLYGIDFSSDEEYHRRNMFYWMMGYVTASGMKVTICPGGYMSDTCESYMFEDDGKAYLSDLRRIASDQYNKAEATLNDAEKSKIYLRGVLDTLSKIERR